MRDPSTASEYCPVRRAAAAASARRYGVKRRISGCSRPFESGALAVNLQAEVVEVADRDLARREHAAGAALEPHQHVGVVVEPAPGNERCEIRRHRLDFESGHEQREIMRVHAYVGETGRRAGARRIGAPFRLFLTGGVNRLRQPILDIAGVNDPYDRRYRRPRPFRAPGGPWDSRCC